METALSLLIIFTISLAVFEFSILIYTYCAFNEAVREGVRYAITHGATSPSCSGPSSDCTDSSAANVKAAVTNATLHSFEPLVASDVQVAYSPGNSCAPSTSVTVSVTKAYVPLVAFLGIKPTLTVKSQGRIVY